MLGGPGVERAAVALVPRNGHDVIALVVMAPERAVVADVERRLRDLLPEYMRPALVAWSPVLTVSSTGKTDENRLMRQLAQAAADSSATHFAFTAGGDVEPVDGDGDA